jgi:Fe-S-cluster containining protein
MMALCGHCSGPCCSTLRIPITRSDARRLAQNLKTTVARLPLLPLDGLEEEPDDLAGYLSKGASPCAYFDRGCTVHGFRPDVCRSFGLNACVGTGSFVPLRRPTRPAGPC